MSKPNVNPSTLPAGHARDEAMKQVADQLAEQADASPLQGANPAAMDFDEELQHQYDHFADLYTPQPGWAYRWVYIGAQGRDMNNGMVQHRTEGWVPVKAGDAEITDEFSMGLNAFGLYVLGDCALMKIPAARKAALDHAQELRQRAKEAGTLEEARACVAEAQKVLQQKHGWRGTITTFGSQEQVEGTANALEAAAPQFLGKLKAQNQFSDMLRNGNIPGVKLTTQTL